MQVFISHASSDQQAATALIERLTSSGIQVWNPYEEIFPGDNWAQKTGQALEQSEVMVVLVTPNAMNSELLQQNVQYALTSGHYRGRLVPVMLGTMDEASRDAGIPWVLRKMDPLYIQPNEAGWDEVADRIRALAQRDCNVAG
jgi:hypothetical protein